MGRRLGRRRSDQHDRRTQLEGRNPAPAFDRPGRRPSVGRDPPRTGREARREGQRDVPHPPAGDHDDHARARARRQAEDHALVQGVYRILGPLERRVDEQARPRDMDDSFESSVHGAEGSMTIDRRQEDDREPAPLVRPDIDAGQQRAQRILDPFDGQEPPPSTRPTSWTVPSHGLRMSGVSAGIGRCSGFTPRVNRALKDRYVLEGTIRLLFVQAGRIHPGIQVPEQTLPQSSRGDRQAREFDPEDREAQSARPPWMRRAWRNCSSLIDRHRSTSR